MGKPKRFQVYYGRAGEPERLTSGNSIDGHRLRATLLSIADGLIVTDPQSRIILINQHAAELTGWSRQEATGEMLFQVFRVTDRRGRGFEDPARKALEMHKHFGLGAHAVLIARDGGERRITGTVAPIDDGHGNASGAVLVFRDNTERHKLEERTRMMAADYETVFNGTQDALFLIDVQEDRQFHFRRSNDAHARLTGYTEAQFRDHTPQEIMGQDVGHMLEANCRRCLRALAPVSYEETLYFPGGERTWHTTLSPIIIDGGVVQIVGSSHDVTGRKRVEEQIKYLSFHDKLTGLYNRAYFEEELRRLDTERELPLSVIMGDINGLKLVNDAFGHQEGDRLLIKIAEILRASCRQEDIIARWGGDEFVILLPETSEQVGLEVAARIRRACEETSAEPIKPSIALGVATKAEASRNVRTVLKEAEDWMYRKKLIESRNVRSSVISSLQKTLGEKTHETGEHAQRLQDRALAMGRALKLSDRELDQLALLAMLHDIGKIAIPAEVIGKPGHLSQEELTIMKKHPEIGYRIATSSYELADISDAILAHHEHWDGRGYPQGRTGVEIPLISRILAIVDAFDVMTTGRPYKEAIGLQEALRELKRCSGSQFDPQLVELFLNLCKASA